MSSRSFKYWPEVTGVVAAILFLLLSSCAPEDKDSPYYTYKLPRYQYCIDVEGKTYFVKDFSRRSVQHEGNYSVDFTDIDGVDYSFSNVSYCKRRVPVKPTKREACVNDLPAEEPTQSVKPTKCAACGSTLAAKELPRYVKSTKCEACGSDLATKPTKCEACGSDLTGKEPPQPVKPIKCEACGNDLTGKEHAHAR